MSTEATRTDGADGRQTRGRRNARERILAAAYELFSARGVQDVGIDAVIRRADVARMTLYRHFATKDDLVLEFLAQREQRWTCEWLQAEVMKRADNPSERLLAIFEVFDEWFHKDDFEGCAFVTILLEAAGTNPKLRDACAKHLENIRTYLESLASEVGVANIEVFVYKWHILMKGSIVSALEGNRNAARHAHEIAQVLLEQATPT